MLQGKKAYICSPLSARNPEGVQHNMELAKYYLMQMKRLYHCRTFASHAHLPLMLDDRIPEERETAMQIGALMLDLCEVLIICGSCISEGMRREIQTPVNKFIFIVSIKASNICLIHIHDCKIMTNLQNIVFRNPIICPFVFCIVITGFTFQNPNAAIWKTDKVIHIR